MFIGVRRGRPREQKRTDMAAQDTRQSGWVIDSQSSFAKWRLAALEEERYVVDDTYMRGASVRSAKIEGMVGGEKVENELEVF